MKYEKKILIRDSETELSDWVYNSEDLYDERFRPEFIETLESLFVFNQKQLFNLLADLESEENENEI